MEELTRLIGDLVAIDSTNPDLVPGGAGEAEIARYVAAWLERAGLEVTIEEAGPGRPNVIAVAKGAGVGRSLMLNAHMDTVGAGGMVDPLVPRIEGDRLHGRGAYDMKASLAAIMLAGRGAARSSLAGDVIVTAVADEEYASIGVQKVIESWRADAAIVTEPTGLDLTIAHKGFVWLDVETRGVAAHGSLPEAGVDAIAAMGPVLTGIAALETHLASEERHPLLGPASIHASLISGGQELSTYPDRCRLSIERRTIPGETIEQVESQLGEILERAVVDDLHFDATVTTTLVRDPFSIAPDHPFVGIVSREVEVVRGATPALTGAAGWMDSAFLASAGIPTVIFGPGGVGAHADVEWVDLPSAEKVVDALVQVIHAWCA